MKYQECIDLMIRTARDAGSPITKDEAQDLSQLFEARLKNRPGKISSQTDLQEVLQEAQELNKQAKINASQKKREQLISAKIYGQMIQRMENYGENPFQAILAMLGGDSTLKAGSRDSIDAKQKGIMLRYSGSFALALNKKDPALEKIFRDGTLDREIYLYRYGDDTVRANTSPQAKQIADTMEEVQQAILQRKNAAGAYVGELDDYVVKQNHDAIFMRKDGVENWKAFIESKLDVERTFKNLKPGQSIDEFLEESYYGLVTGVHIRADQDYGIDGDGVGLIGTPGYSNLARKLSASRKLHFKDGNAAYEYSQKYSRGNLNERFMTGLERDARNLSLIETLGPNPEAMLTRVVNDLEQKYKTNDTVMSGFNKKKIEGQFGIVSNSLNVPGNVSLAKLGFMSRALQSMSKLGFATISSFADVVAKAETLNRRTDRGVFNSYYMAFKQSLSLVPTKDKKKLGLLTKVGMEAKLGNVHARVSADDSFPGVTSKLMQLFFKVNGLEWWTQSGKNGVAAILAADLGFYKNTSFKKIPKNTKRSLELYGITEDDWSVVKFMETEDVGGVDYITPEAVMSLENSQIDAAVSKKYQTTNVTDELRAKFKNDLADKITTYFSDTADEAIPTPGAREQYFLTLGSQRGTAAGEAIRTLAQFKAFPVTYITKQMMTTTAAGGGLMSSGGVMNLSRLVLAATAAGYVSMMAKDVLKGKEPRDPRSPDTMKAALLQGGGLGLYGDFMFGEYNRYGRSLAETLAGPTVGTLQGVASIYAKAIEGNADAGDFLRVAKANTPFANIFWTQAAMDYLLLYGLMEMNDPGYLRRMERRVRREQEQEFWLSPSQSAVRY
tara:strand:- start:30 stop:2549 length:2520 start_codon:yes stop_codon:yes gene_type:complete